MNTLSLILFGSIVSVASSSHQSRPKSESEGLEVTYLMRASVSVQCIISGANSLNNVYCAILIKPLVYFGL